MRQSFRSAGFLRAFVTRPVCAVVCLLAFVSTAFAQGHPILDVAGFQQNRDYFSESPMW